MDRIPTRADARTSTRTECAYRARAPKRAHIAPRTTTNAAAYPGHGRGVSGPTAVLLLHGVSGPRRGSRHTGVMLAVYPDPDIQGAIRARMAWVLIHRQHSDAVVCAGRDHGLTMSWSRPWRVQTMACADRDYAMQTMQTVTTPSRP
jgi:hypothetical protein